MAINAIKHTIECYKMGISSSHSSDNFMAINAIKHELEWEQQRADGDEFHELPRNTPHGTQLLLHRLRWRLDDDPP